MCCGHTDTPSGALGRLHGRNADRAAQVASFYVSAGSSFCGLASGGEGDNDVDVDDELAERRSTRLRLRLKRPSSQLGACVSQLIRAQIFAYSFATHLASSSASSSATSSSSSHAANIFLFL